ncbi:HBL371Cp [Eremothecium sinecaudum]|uniref:non-chaperonin molecular chaperone ATPase n=1 Tax=Eremothecium sinecaudum TaxID=45286 RepID=A0A125RDT3_9SACH|nr:HBL371Cp [Eremothecium sinecaudum]AMD18531.1 HBL371Cp [Eremothecium sinecaudum]
MNLCSPINRLFLRQASTKVIGIDLGTTNSAVAYIRDSNNLQSATIIENDQGQRTTPSIVAYNKAGDAIVGSVAKRQAALNPKSTFFATKRLIGRLYDDPETQRDLKTLPYKIIRNEENAYAYLETSNGQVKSPAEIGSVILSYLRKSAEEYLNEKIDKAVVTVPAYFNDAQRQATKEAGTMIGLKVLRVVNEPTAAALSFGLNAKNNGLVAVYDLGGGTFDISLLDIEGGVFEVKATNGDTHLGGEDFDNVLVNYIVDEFIKQNPGVEKTSITSNGEVIQRIKDAAEKAKIELSHVSETVIDLPFIYDEKHLQLTLKEEELDNMTMHLIKKTIAPVYKALSDADVEPEDVDEIILVGGMTRMPKIRSMVSEVFNKKVNTTVNPDETVALGAAIQGGILSGEIKNVLLLDVTPLTLGIETFGGVFSPLIPRNTTIPIRKTEAFSTGADGQTGVEIRIYQGERGLVRDNIKIGDFTLAGIPPKPKGTPQIQVTFDIDADGIITVSAKEVSSGKEHSVNVIPNTGLTEAQIQKIIEEANANKERDMLIKKRLEVVNNADLMITDTEGVFEKHQNLINKEESYPGLLETLKNLRTKINHFKANDSDMSIDVDQIKRQADALQLKALQLFRDVSKKQNTK